jgi:hypothetical protein
LSTACWLLSYFGDEPQAATTTIAADIAARRHSREPVIASTGRAGTL